MAYNKHMENVQKIQVIRPVNEQDKTVHKAIQIQKTFKVLPYPEVEKRLDKIVDYSLVDKKYSKGSV